MRHLKSNYEATPEGTQKLINDLESSSGDFAISLIDFQDGRVFAADGDKRHVAASTYKLFVAYSVIKRVEGGSMSFDDKTVLGRTVWGCLEVMIVRSDNSCAEMFGYKIGWRNVESDLKAIGILNSGFGTDYAYSTTNDQVAFLKKLYDDQLMGLDNKQKLVDTMVRQIYRKGIPAGSQSARVADKVGFLGPYLNDSGIVYSPSGDYALSIYSKSSSWSMIAELASRVSEQLKSY